MHKEYDFSRGKRGAVMPSFGKTRITIMLDNEVIEALKIDKLTVFGGLDGVLKDVVRINLPAA